MLLNKEHIEYVKSLDHKKDELSYWYSAHLRLSGLYWGYTTCLLLREPAALDRAEIVRFVLECRHANGGFGAHPGHDAHLLYTLSGLQLLLMTGSLDQINREQTADYILGLRREDGSFMGDEYGEVDSRLVYVAVQSLAILGQLDRVGPETAAWLASCQNFDGGFGLAPEAESHAGQAFVVLGALDILGSLEQIDQDRAAWWLSDRQTASGGLNGRPEKLPDVCYSWWVLSSLSILNKLEWIDGEALRKFIYAAQDPRGGIADREGDAVDVYHTLFGIAGLSLLGYDDLEPIDPTFCMPTRFTGGLKRSP